MHSRHHGALLTPGAQHEPRAESALRVVAAATDFRATATVAVRRAAQLCRASGARLHLVHVASPGGRRQPSAAAAVTRLRQSAARLIAEFDVPVETHLGVGSVAGETALLAQGARADLIVLGNSRKGLVAEILRLNTVLRLRRQTRLPLLAVSDALLRPYRFALLASDLSPESAQAGRRARQLFPDARLVVLHALQSAYAGMLALRGLNADARDADEGRARLEAMERLRAFARGSLLQKDALLRVDVGHPALCARREAQALAVDLIVLQPTKGWFDTGVTDHLVADPPCDLLLMP
jgi:nucleotide-binding universal stress UspA family protein